MTKSKLERLVEYATELCGELDAPGYLSMATGASILKTCTGVDEIQKETCGCFLETLFIIDKTRSHISTDILASLIARIMYESEGHIQDVQFMHDSALASIRGALNKKVIDHEC